MSTWTNPDTALPGITGAGTTLSFTPKGGTLTPIGTVQDLDGPKETVGEVESTRLASAYKPYAPTLPEGEMSFTIQHVGADPGVQAVRAMTNHAPVPIVLWTITYPDGSTDVFPGFSKGYEVQSVENEAIITASVNIRLTGPITYTYPAAPAH